MSTFFQSHLYVSDKQKRITSLRTKPSQLEHSVAEKKNYFCAFIVFAIRANDECQLAMSITLANNILLLRAFLPAARSDIMKTVFELYVMVVPHINMCADGIGNE